MKRHVSFIAIFMLLCLSLTGCGSKAIEEGTTYLEDGNYKKAVTKFKQWIKDRIPERHTVALV